MSTVYECVVEGRPVETLFIDVHGHFGPWPETTIPYAMDYARAIAEMDRYGCDMAWLSASNPGYGGDIAAKNDYVFDFASQHPDRIVPYCTLSANSPERALDELKRCLGRGRCIGVKMHRYQQPAYTMRSDLMQPILEVLAERHLVYINHTYTDHEALRWAAQKYPDVTFVSGHVNPAINILARDCPNLFDCTCAAMDYREVEHEVERLGRSDSMLVGSDFGLFQLGFGVGMVAYARIDEEHKRRILGLNALEILKRVSSFKDVRFAKHPASQ